MENNFKTKRNKKIASTAYQIRQKAMFDDVARIVPKIKNMISPENS
jgi:hypothetical protein